MGRAVPANEIEYTIYTFEFPKEGKSSGKNKWKKHSSSKNQTSAMEEAEKLSSSRKFEKVEVKKKFIDKKKGRTVDMTIKVFENTQGFVFGTKSMVTTIVMCGILAFVVTYYIAQTL